MQRDTSSDELESTFENTFPDEIWVNILSYLNTSDLVNMGLMSSHYRISNILEINYSITFKDGCVKSTSKQKELQKLAPKLSLKLNELVRNKTKQRDIGRDL